LVGENDVAALVVFFYRNHANAPAEIGGTVLRAGTCLISAGVAAVAVALLVKSLGTQPDLARDIPRAERLGISVIQNLHSNAPAAWTPVFWQVPDNAELHAAKRETKTSLSGDEPSEDSAVFEERFSFQDRFASFEERFFGVAKLLRRVAVKVVKTELIGPQHAIASNAKLRDSAPNEAEKGELAMGHRVVAALSPAASSSIATAARNQDGASKVRHASLSSGENQNRTAIYDISAQVVYLPNGRRLEAHSGFGSYMDDPRSVHIKRKGATPPNTYRLVMREKLFHGVQAIRLIPVGDGNMFGRDGILAHHYLLGPNGQSNGCVSLANYPEFLNSYLNGEIDRLVVVERLANPPGSVIAASWLEKAFKGFVKTFERGSGT
jgi:hypothetical protein